MKNYSGLELAVIGISCRFPGARNTTQYWENLTHSQNCIHDFTDEEVLAEGESKLLIRNPLYIKSRAYLENKHHFDAAFFNYRSEEAELMDPQMRIFHECCWEALEDSGYGNKHYRGKVGLFSAGSSNLPWMLYANLKNREGYVDNFSVSPLSDITFLSSRVSYLFDFKGPTLFLQTACSSSLVAVHEACKSLLLGECSVALAGGVTIANHSKKGYLYQEGLIFSKDGACRPFDEEASGTVSGEGAGVVVLKRLKDAIESRDHIYAIIKGSAVNNDGKNKVGYTAPSVKGQAEVIKKALKMAQVEPETIKFIEGHGTGTKLGDPIEVEALNKVFKGGQPKSCMLGSVKSNMGHLDSAAGVAGLIKAILVLKNKQVPPTLHFKKANPEIDFEGGPFFVNNALEELDSHSGPLRAGVSSFGIGGTNVHVVLEEAPPKVEKDESRKYQLLAFSAKSKWSLEEGIKRLTDFLKEENESALPDVAYTLLTGRERFKYRKVYVCEEKQELVKLLSEDSSPTYQAHTTQEVVQNTIFMFPGQGTQYVNMCRDLYESESEFRRLVDACITIANKYVKNDLNSILFPDLETSSASLSKINNTQYAQPLLFTIQYALAQLLLGWGLKPDFLIGHSIGEYVAACISGVFKLDDALRLVVKRGELMSKVEEGDMLSLTMSTDELSPLLKEVEGVELAVVNSASSLVVSGKTADIEDFKTLLDARNDSFKVLKTSHAFHSYMMDDILEAFEREFRNVSIEAPQIPFVSNVTGEIARYEQINTPSYWSSQLRNAVQFHKGTEFLVNAGNAVFIEVGPGKSLCNYVRENKQLAGDHHLINLVRHPKQQVNDQKYLVEKIGQLWLNGLDVDWKQYYKEEKRYKVSIPSYSFEQVPFPADFNVEELISGNGIDKSLYQEADETSMVHVPNWVQSIPPNPAAELKEKQFNVLVIADAHGFSAQLIKELELCGQKVIEGKLGNLFREIKSNQFELDRLDVNSYAKLWELLHQKGILIDHIIYGANLSLGIGAVSFDQVDTRLETDYLSFIQFLQSLSSSKQTQTIRLSVIDNFLTSVKWGDQIDPIKSTVLGPAKIVPLEVQNVQCKIVEIPYPFEASHLLNTYVKKVINEIFYDSEEPIVVYRDNERFVRTFTPLNEDEKLTSGVQIQPKASYIITGGFGGIGFTIAKDLVFEKNADIIIIHRSFFPERRDWGDWLEANGTKDPISKKIQEMLEMERAGCKVTCYQLDVTKEDSVRDFLHGLEASPIEVKGIIWAAGEPDLGGIIANRSKDDYIKYLTAKIHGLLLFEQYIDFEKLDFLALFSSIGNVFYQSEYGQVAYVSANEFLDSYSSYVKEKYGVHAFSINWCAWLDVGMAVNSIRRKQNIEDINLINTSIPEGIYPEEGMLAFYKCLSSKAAVNTVFKGDVNVAIKRKRQELNKAKEALASVALGAEATQSGKQESLAQTVIDIFGQFFGRKDMGLTDNFFEIGGDSLKGMMLVARINNRLKSKITLNDLFTFPVIQHLIDEVIVHSEKEEIPIPQAPDKTDYALTPSQNRLYFLQNLYKDSTAYNECRMYRIEGEIDFDRLETTLSQLIQRHEILRTAFVFQEDSPRQVIVEDYHFEIEHYHAPNGKTDEIVQSFIRPFDLSKAPLLRIGIVEISKREYLFMIDMHHIMYDAHSSRIFTQEFLDIYNGKNTQAVKRQFKDYSEWLNGSYLNEKKKIQRNFWVQEFSDMSMLNMPRDYERPLVKDFKGKQIKFELTEWELGQLREIAQKESVSFYMLTLSIFSVFLAKISNQEDVVLGTVTSGRSHPDMEKIIGMFVNTVPLRYFPKSDVSFKSFIQQVKSRTLAFFNHQNYPYEELIDELKLPRDTGRNPIFDVFFSYYNFEETEFHSEGLKLNPYTVESHLSSRFDITFDVFDLEEEFYFAFGYATSLFSDETINRFIQYFKAILSQVISNHEILISEINMLSPEEEHQILTLFNDTKVSYPAEKSIIDLFEEQVRKTPNNLAIRYGDNIYTFKEVHEISSQIAVYLQTMHSVKKGDFIGLMLEREEYLIFVILAIWKASAVYVPFDPKYPSERIRDILDDGGINILITRERYLSGKSITDTQIIDLDKEIHSIDNCPTDGVEGRPKGEDLAYIIYTSGSTGKPKGVMVEHHSVINRLLWGQKEYALDENDVVLQKTPIIFDVSIWELFWWSFTGSSLYLLAPGEEKYPDKLVSVIEDNGISVIHFVPSMLGTFLSTLNENFDYSKLKSLKRVFTSGEALRVEHVKLFGETIHEQCGTGLINLYGPTEGTIEVSCFECDFTKEYSDIPIGKPIDNIQLYIFNDFFQLNPVNVPGELCIAGVGVTRGYFGREALTAEKFVENPFSPDEKMYVTGDIAKWIPDGNIQFLGRKDNQVKIRGFRIELKEIENWLNEHPEIKESLVLVKERGEDKYLIAYYISEEVIEPSELKHYVLTKLPHYMVPSFFVQLHSFPLTPNGKIDKKALAAPKIEDDLAYIGPINEVEEKLVSIWAEILKLDEAKISVEKSFFDLGGHSLNIITLVSRINDYFNCEISIASIFRLPTIKHIADYIKHGDDSISSISTSMDDAISEAEDLLKNINL